jgi:hypothetical protein
MRLIGHSSGQKPRSQCLANPRVERALVAEALTDLRHQPVRRGNGSAELPFGGSLVSRRGLA